MDLKEQITETAEQKLAENGSFLVEVKVTPSKIFVFIDHAEGIQLENCIQLNRFLQEKFEGTDVFETHELEVSSPGMDEPLRVLKQYLKRIGQKVSVLMKDGIRKEGILKSASELEITIEETIKIKVDGKKEAKIISTIIPLNEIKETKVAFSFKEIKNYN
jgi:ribosome maturation factor RimP